MAKRRKGLRAQERYYSSYGPAPKLPKPKPKPTPPAFRRAIPERAFVPQQRQAQRKTTKAVRKLPERPLPAIPTLRKPTERQRQHAAKLVQRSIRKQAGGRDVRRTAEVMEALMSDPRSVRRLAPVNAQARAALERQYAARGRAALPAPKKGRRYTRAQLVATGELLAQRDQGRAGPGKLKIPLTGQSAGITGAGLRSAIGSVTSLGKGQAATRQIVKNTVKDVGRLGTAPFVASVEITKALNDLRKGKPDTLEDLAAETAKATVETYKHPIKSFREGPISTALAFGGPISAGGRTAGALARGAGKTGAKGVRGKLADVGSTVRSPIALSNDPAAVKAGAYHERTSSKDLTRKMFDRTSDAAREPVRDAKGNKVMVEQRGRMVPVLKPTEKELKGGVLPGGRGGRSGLTGRRANFASSRATMVERNRRAEADELLGNRATRAGRRHRIKGRANRDAVALVVEGTIRGEKTWDLDLRAHRAKLNREYDQRMKEGGKSFRHSEDAEANRRRVAQITALLDATPEQRAAIVSEGKRIGGELNEREKGLVTSGVLSDAERAKRARLIPAAIEHLGARYDQKTDRVVGPKGQTLSTLEIERGLRSQGLDPDKVAYLPHRADVRGRRAFHTQFRAGSRPIVDKREKRTGEAYRAGTTEASAEILREQATRQGTQLAKAEQLDKLVAEGMKRPDGKHWTGPEAIEAAERIAADTGEELVPVRAFGARLPSRVRTAVAEGQGTRAMETLHEQMLNARIVDADDNSKARNVVLMPAKLIAELEEQVKAPGVIDNMLRAVNAPFRYGVLPQPRWLTGNAIEPVVRLTAAGSGVNVFGLAADLRATKKVMRAMKRSDDPAMRAAAEEIESQQFGGLFIGGGQARAVFRNLDDYPNVKRAYGNMVAKLPATEHAAEFVALLTRGALTPAKWFFQANRVMERQFQKAAFGRQFRKDFQEFSGSWTKALKLEEKAVAEAAKGLVNTATQQRFMREQHKLLGQYDGFGPIQRRMVQGPMPFVPWAMNAARFLYWAMPAEQTVKTSVLMAVDSAVREDYEAEQQGVPEGSLRYALKTPRGGRVDIARYTPFGLATDDPVETIISQFMPQFSGGIAAVRGLDPFGQPLKFDPREVGPEGPSKTDKYLAAGYSQLEAVTPYLSMFRRLQEKGGTAYAGSTIFDPDVKPETVGQMSAARRTLDPFRPVYVGGKLPERKERKRRPKPKATPKDPIAAALRRSAGTQQSGFSDAVREALVRNAK